MVCYESVVRRDVTGRTLFDYRAAQHGYAGCLIAEDGEDCSTMKGSVSRLSTGIPLHHITEVVDSSVWRCELGGDMHVCGWDR